MRDKILVTGGLGYIGSHTVVELLNNNFEVIVIDNLSNSNLGVIDGIKSITGKDFTFINIDLIQKDAVETFFSNYKNEVSGIIHFAAYKAVGESMENPLKYYENNIYSLVNILSSIKKYSLEINFIFSSSCTVYGDAKSLPITESTPIGKPESTYGYTKQICEKIIQDFMASYSKMNAIILRYFNPIGAHPTSKIGELPIGKPQNLVPFITQTAIGLYPELKVFGDDYSTKDGTCIRDYIDVVDLSNAHLLSLIKLKESTKRFYEIYNIGTGIGQSVLEVIKCFEDANQVKINYNIANRREGDVESIYASTIKANDQLNWKSKTPLKESLINAWEWEKKNKK